MTSPTEVFNHPVEITKATLQLDADDATECVDAALNLWEAEPGFAAKAEIVLSEYLSESLVVLDAALARALVPRIHQFAEDLAKLADQLDAITGGA